MLGQKVANAFLSRGSIVIWSWCFYTALIFGGFTTLCYNYHEEAQISSKNYGGINPWLPAANSTVELISLNFLLLYILTRCDVTITLLRRSRSIRNNVPFECFDWIGGFLLYAFGFSRAIVLGLAAHISYRRMSETICPRISTLWCVNHHIAIVWFMAVIFISRRCCKYEVYHWNKKLMIFIYIGTILLSPTCYKVLLTIAGVLWLADYILQSFNRTHSIISAAVLMDDYMFLKIRRTTPSSRDADVHRSCSATLSVRNLSQYTLNSHNTDDSNDPEIKPPMSLVVADPSDCMSINATTASSDIDIFLHRRLGSATPGWADWIRSLLTNWNQKTLEQHEGTYVNILVPCISHVNGHPFFVREVDENYMYLSISVIKGGWTWQLWGMLALVSQEVPYVRIQMNSSRSDYYQPQANNSKRRESMSLFRNPRTPVTSAPRHFDRRLSQTRSSEFCPVGTHRAAVAMCAAGKLQKIAITADEQRIDESSAGRTERRLASAQAYPTNTGLYAFEQAPEQLVSFEPLPHEINEAKASTGRRAPLRARFMRSKTTGGISTRYRAICKTALTNMGSLESSLHRSVSKASNADQQRVSISPIAHVVEITSSKSSEVLGADDISEESEFNQKLPKPQQTERAGDKWSKSSRDSAYQTNMHGKIIGQPRPRLTAHGAPEGSITNAGCCVPYSPIDDPQPRSFSEICSSGTAHQIYAKCVTDVDITEGLRRRKATQQIACVSRQPQSPSRRRIEMGRCSSSSGRHMLPLTNVRGSPAVTRAGDTPVCGDLEGKVVVTTDHLDKLSLVNIHKATPPSILKSTLDWDQKLIVSIPVYSKMPVHDGSRHVVLMCADYGIYKALARIKIMFESWLTDNRKQLVRDTADLFKQQLQKSSTTNKCFRENIPFRKNEKFDSLFATFYKFLNGLYNVILLMMTPMCAIVDLTFITAWLIAILMTGQFLSVIADAGRIAEQMMDSVTGVRARVLKVIDCSVLLITIGLIAFNYAGFSRAVEGDAYALSGRIGALKLHYDCTVAYNCERTWSGPTSSLVILIGLALTDLYRAIRNFNCAYWLKSDGLVRSGVFTQCCGATTLDCIWVMTEDDPSLLTYVHEFLASMAHSIRPSVSKPQRSCCAQGANDDSSHQPSNGESSTLNKSFTGRDFTFKIVVPPHLKNKWAWFQYPIFEVVTSNSHAVLKSCIQKRNASLNRGAKIRLELSEDHKTGRDVACCWQDLKDYVKIISKNNGEIHVATT